MSITTAENDLFDFIEVSIHPQSISSSDSITVNSFAGNDGDYIVADGSGEQNCATAAASSSMVITQSGTIRDIILEDGWSSTGTNYAQGYSFSIVVPQGKQASITVNTDFANMVNCSRATVVMDVNGKRVNGLSFTINENSKIRLSLIAQISQPFYNTCYAKCNAAVNVQYSILMPQADLQLYTPDSWSSSMIIASRDSLTNQTKYTTDDDLYIKIAYGNFGTLASAPFYYSLTYDGKTVNGYDTGKAVNGIAGLSLHLGKLAPGTHTFQFNLDVTNSVNESNESNNVITRTITVLDSNLPDLKISAVQIPTGMSDRQLFDISISVTNSGRMAAAASTMHVFYGTEKIGSYSVESLAVGQTVQKSFTVQPEDFAVGTHKLTFVVDVEDNVSELNEMNNSTVAEFTLINAVNAPETPIPGGYTFSENNQLVLSWTPADNRQVAGYQLLLTPEDEDAPAELITLTANSYTLANPEKYVSWQVRTFDSTQQYSYWSEPENYYIWKRSDRSDVSFTYDECGYELSSAGFSKDDFEHYLSFICYSGNGFDCFGLPHGVWNVRTNMSEQYKNGQWNNVFDEQITVIALDPDHTAPVEFSSVGNGNEDLFFVNAHTTWSSGFAAEHKGEFKGWQGTSEMVELVGKNRCHDIFAGSTDSNTIVMTDSSNGDTLFLEDIYSAFGDQGRLKQIDKIFAGAGDDIIDLTSQLYNFSNSAIKIYGGTGNDTVWANSGSNNIFGDAGNDRIIGGSGNDLIVGGSGNDTMHGGGGSDTFTFGQNWGNDFIEQLSNGSIRIWIDDGSIDYWNAESLTYDDGRNSIQVIGVVPDQIQVVFGIVDSVREYDRYRTAGCFDAECTNVIFGELSAL